MLTRKHYKALAAEFRFTLDHARLFAAACDTDTNDSRKAVAEAVQSIAKGVADICASDNPRFDRNKFFVACGIYR